MTSDSIKQNLDLSYKEKLHCETILYVLENEVDLDIKFTAMESLTKIHDDFNRMVSEAGLGESCTVKGTDSASTVRKKCKKAFRHGLKHYPMNWIYSVSGTHTDTGGMSEYGSNAMSARPRVPARDNDEVHNVEPSAYPNSGYTGAWAKDKVTPPKPLTLRFTDDETIKREKDEFVDEAESSTERVRRYYKRHPEKVRAYLRKTVKDRVARNRDRAKAVKKHGKAKMKNHDVHHPNGAQNGNWRLAKKDHGRDKVNESTDNNITCRFCGWKWKLSDGGNRPYMCHKCWQENKNYLMEGGAYGHMLHPYDDLDLTFGNMKELVNRALGQGLDKEGPVVEKTDGQNIMFTVKDGKIRFARSTKHLKNQGEESMTVDELKEKFADRGSIEHTFGTAGDDLQAAIENLTPEQIEELFGEGNRFMSVEIIHPDSENTIPYGKKMLILHHTVEFNDDGKPVTHYPEHSDVMADALKNQQADQQAEYGIRGQQYIVFDDEDTEELKEKRKEYLEEIEKIQEEYGLDDSATLRDYKLEWWSRKIDEEAPDSVSEEDRKRLAARWGAGEKGANKLASMQSLKDSQEAKEWASKTDKGAKEIDNREAIFPIQSMVARLGVDATMRSADLLASHNPMAGMKVRQKLARATQHLKSSNDPEILDKYERFFQTIDDIGLDRIIPSEGLIFTFGGKLYKFTGGFAPVHRIVGAVKFGRDEPTDIKQDKEEPSVAQKVEKDTEEKKRKLAGLLNKTVVNPQTGKQIQAMTAYKAGPNHPAYQAVMSMLRSEVLSEGGKAIKTNSKIPNRYADSTAEFARRSLGMGDMESSLVGSTQKPVMGDLDIAVDEEDMKKLVGYEGSDKKEFYQALKDHFADSDFELNVNSGLEQISISAPLVDSDGNRQKAVDGDGKETDQDGTVQVDVMIGNLPWMQKWLVNGDVSEHSSAFRNNLIMEVLRTMVHDTEEEGVQWRYIIHSKRGLMKQTFTINEKGKRKAISTEPATSDLDEVAKILFGEEATWDQIDTFEKLNDRVKDPDGPFADKKKEIYQAFRKTVEKVIKKGTPKGLPDEYFGKDGADAESSEQPAPKKPVALYPGRFQPYHAGHHETYQQLVDKFGEDNVYIITSDKTDPIKSPFDFNEKKDIIHSMFGVPQDRIVQIKNPYSPREVLDKLPEGTPVVFALGEKDAGRVPYAPYEDGEDLAGHEEKAYLYVAPPPSLKVNGREISGTEVRHILGSDKYTDRAKQEIFTKIYGTFDQRLFDKITKKTAEAEKSKEMTDKYSSEKSDDKQKDSTSKDLSPQAKRAKSVLKQKVRNPKTGRDIYVATALKYSEDEPARQAAEKIVRDAMSIKEFMLTENKELDKLKVYVYTRDFTDEEMENELGEYFENKKTKTLFPDLADSEEELQKMIEDADEIVLSKKQLKDLQNSDVGEVLKSDDPVKVVNKVAKENKKDIASLKNALDDEKDLPMPIVIKHLGATESDKDDGYYLMGGNTRLVVLAAKKYTMPVKVLKYDKLMNLKKAKALSAKLSSKKDKQATEQDPKDLFKKLMQMKITNSETGNQIKIDTAMDYDKNHPAHILARNIIRQHMGDISSRAGVAKDSGPKKKG